jgi:hypothetical protein
MGAKATEAQPAGVAGLEATGTGIPPAAAGAGPEYPAWLRSMGAKASEAPPAGGAALEATGWPGAPPAPTYPTWGSLGALQRAASPAVPEAAAVAGDVVASEAPTAAAAVPRASTRGAPLSRFAEFSPEARAARAAGRAAPTTATDPDQAAALEALMQSPAFLALLKK